MVPGSSRAGLAGRYGDRIKIRVTSPPVGGRANDEVGELLEHAIGEKVHLIRGMTSRNKVFEIVNTDVETVRRKLGLAN